MAALANAFGHRWPLFITPIPHAVIPWLVVHGDDWAAERS